MKALSTLQNESFVKAIGNGVSSKMSHLLRVWFLMFQVQRQDFGGMSHGALISCMDQSVG